MTKLYIVVRRDLLPGAQVAQSCHAMSAFADAFPDAHRDWHRNGQNLVVVTVADEVELDRLYARASERGLQVKEFYEPDLGDQMTAVALAGDARSLVSSLPLALRASQIDSVTTHASSGSGSASDTRCTPPGHRYSASMYGQHQDEHPNTFGGPK